ncbi:hypothetical protein [Helicobacter zhangjianzhongii]|uniref:Uncharacterized protein n=1 Tax=Helicobacter zhangjianzhongii TaxID=2974574 RepID=A0ACC6FS22_9HELI|nr:MULTISPECIES: hypothetical protein [unclassified Helicobacter]MDL0080138.1 hypothetical protein [Helicobacter sp. CPD2-1]MDL0081927.1 hypothetical protein [Helicobacter sp. XJK30-2]
MDSSIWTPLGDIRSHYKQIFYKTQYVFSNFSHFLGECYFYKRIVFVDSRLWCFGARSALESMGFLCYNLGLCLRALGYLETFGWLIST